MENININEVISTFNNLQQEITTEEIKLMQLKVSLKFKGQK